MKSRTV